MFGQDDLVEDRLQPCVTVMHGASDPFDRQFMTGCVETLVPPWRCSPHDRCAASRTDR